MSEQPIRVKHVRPDLSTAQAVLSRNLRFQKDEDVKPRKIRYVFVALEFRHAFESDAEISELWSIEWLGILHLVVGVYFTLF